MRILAEAVATAREIVFAEARCAALANVARIRARGGDPDGAAQPITLAVEAAGTIPDSSGTQRGGRGVSSGRRASSWLNLQELREAPRAGQKTGAAIARLQSVDSGDRLRGSG